ncbi:MAG: ORF6N domain-containing protein [Candidatus Brocadiae bacterium]|nr:ORF6N domain-containing protein [Candidatus Brocadiia bacterium]
MDFCFQLSDEEVTILRSQFATAISNMSRTNPYAFTREGANMLSTVLHTDIAIERSIQIIRAFSEMERLKYGLIEIADQFDACKRMAEISGLKGNQAILTASTLVKKLTGYDPLEILGQKQLTSVPQELHLSPTDIGKILEISSQKVNKQLEEAKLQESFRDAKDKKCWKPTAKGKAFSVLKDTNKKHKDRRPVQQLMWLENVVAILKGCEKQTEFTF